MADLTTIKDVLKWQESNKEALLDILKWSVSDNASQIYMSILSAMEKTANTIYPDKKLARITVANNGSFTNTETRSITLSLECFKLDYKMPVERRLDIFFGLFIHELAHQLYTTASCKPYPLIFNILEDARIERAIAKQYPGYAKYLASTRSFYSNIMEPLTAMDDPVQWLMIKVLYPWAENDPDTKKAINMFEDAHRRQIPQAYSIAEARPSTVSQVVELAKEFARLFGIPASHYTPCIQMKPEVDLSGQESDSKENPSTDANSGSYSDAKDESSSGDSSISDQSDDESQDSESEATCEQNSSVSDSTIDTLIRTLVNKSVVLTANSLVDPEASEHKRVVRSDESNSPRSFKASTNAIQISQRVKPALRFAVSAAKAQTSFQYNQEEGELDEDEFANVRFSRSVFTDTKEGKSSDMEIIILVDESGSMTSGIRRDLASDMTNGLALAITQNPSIRLAVYGHTTTGSSTTKVTTYKSFKSKFTPIRAIADWNNKDGFALLEVAQAFSKNANKLIIMISDGEPNGGAGYNGSSARHHVRTVVNDLEKQGVTVLSVAVANFDQRDMYNNVVEFHTAAQVGADTCNWLIKYLKNYARKIKA